MALQAESWAKESHYETHRVTVPNPPTATTSQTSRPTHCLPHTLSASRTSTLHTQTQGSGRDYGADTGAPAAGGPHQGCAPLAPYTEPSAREGAGPASSSGAGAGVSGGPPNRLLLANELMYIFFRFHRCVWGQGVGYACKGATGEGWRVKEEGQGRGQTPPLSSGAGVSGGPPNRLLLANERMYIFFR